LGPATKRLIVNADDFGFTKGVNAGIIEAHRTGILTATTLMANGAAFDDAVRFARENPDLDVGCHLVLVQGDSVLHPGSPLPTTVGALLRALALRRIRVYDELAAQARRIVDAGLCPTHLDTHKHTHILPPVLSAVARISSEFGIPWVRKPFDFPLRAAPVAAPLVTRVTSRGLRVLGRRFDAALASRGARTTDHFAGFQLTGRFRAPQLAALIRQLPAGTTEFMCHPGHCDDALRAAPTRLRESREAEFEALTAPETRRALEDTGVILTNYREL
jgi:predicted glycoside hydrolase/deacetylase ChbG (UPF0249 family)